MATIHFQRRLPQAKFPSRGTEDAAAYDLTAAKIDIEPGSGNLIVDTGLSIAFPPGHVLKIFSRSGLSRKYGIRLVNGTGIIDADYRGPVLILLHSDRFTPQKLMQFINVGDRVAQCILEELPETQWQEVDVLPESVRGVGGFGSTGTK
jgi:deoxyuridine 5''-triphosphate nucleotidohydrolase (dut)